MLRLPGWLQRHLRPAGTRALSSLQASRVDGQRVVNGAILLLSLLVLALASAVGWRAWQEHRSARQASRAQEAAGGFVAASSYRALERTYTLTLLADPAARGSDLRAAIAEARARGDSVWRAAMAETSDLAAQGHDPTDLAKALAAAETAFQRLERARRQVDRCLAGAGCTIGRDNWLRAIQGVLRSSAQMREALFLVSDAPAAVEELYRTIRRWAWTLNEVTTIERGLIAFELARARPRRAETGEEIIGLRGIEAYTLEHLVLIRGVNHLDQRVSAAIDHAEPALAESYWPLRESALEPSSPLSAEVWLRESKPAMAALQRLNKAVSEAIKAHAQPVLWTSRATLAATGMFLLLACAIAVAGITRVRRIANALFLEKELAEVTLRSIGDAVITTDPTGRVEYLNPVAERMTGWTTSEARGLPLEQVFRVVDGATMKPKSNPAETCLRENRVVGLDNTTLLIRRDGNRHHIENSAAPIRDGDGDLVGCVLVFYDTTDAHRAGHLLAYHSTHDSLTGLMRRRWLEQRLTVLLTEHSEQPAKHALLYVDLDQFKVINETFGHSAGDHLLRAVADVIRAQVREGDVLARTGGDEFGLLLAHCPPARAQEIAERLRAAVAETGVEWNGERFDVRVSIGMIAFTAGQDRPITLLGQAEAACRMAKEQGRNRIQACTPGDLALVRQQGTMLWVSRITKALAEDRFALYCQRIVPLAAQGRLHTEILVRMVAEDGALIPPGDFIPAAETYGLMPGIDRWVIRHTLEGLGRVHREGGDALGIVTINLSGATLGGEDLERYIVTALSETGVPPRAVCFEITETAAIANLRQAVRLIQSLKAQGCRFALDDFGSGMSSFMYLKQLAVDYLKIDGSFVRHIAWDQTSFAMVRAIHAMGAAMGLATIAEFVEDDAILRRLRTIGVDYVQGYAVGCPQPFDDWLAAAS
jgi:diguanylate cyclase (GGDEF)-like protein/PAS domain S-box-containing protein